MKRAVVEAPRELAIYDLPDPEPGPDDVLIRVAVALTCGTDLKLFRRGHPKFPFPRPLGHEFVGVVEAVGDTARDAAAERGIVPGAKIVSAPTGPCDACVYCELGHPNLCVDISETMVWGAFGGKLLLPRRVWSHNAYPVPDGLQDAEAAFLEPLSCCVYGASQLQIGGGVRTAVVIGAGPIGLLFARVLAIEGLEVIVLGRHGSRLDAARAMGITEVVDVDAADPVAAVRERTDGLGACIVVECTGRKDVWEMAPDLVRKAGQVLLFGGCPGGTKVEFDATRIHYDDLVLRGAFHYTPAAVKRSLELLASGKVRTEPLLSGRRTLAQLGETLAALERGEGVKYAITPD